MITIAEMKPISLKMSSSSSPSSIDKEPTQSSSMSPADYVRCLIPQELEPQQPELCLNKTQAMDGYTMEVVGAIRSNDVAALRFMLEHGKCFDVCNANGEYLIHLACRRAEPETVDFLINEAQVRVDVRDTMGRTILHDVCWKSSPDLSMMSTVSRLVPPPLLLAKDMRGFTPFDYARKEHWGQWMNFLAQQKEVIQERLLEQQ